MRGARAVLPMLADCRAVESRDVHRQERHPRLESLASDAEPEARHGLPHSARRGGHGCRRGLRRKRGLQDGEDRESGVEGKRVELGGRRIIKKKKIMIFHSMVYVYIFPYDVLIISQIRLGSLYKPVISFTECIGAEQLMASEMILNKLLDILLC